MVLFEVGAPLTDLLWKMKLGQLNNSYSNSDVISLSSSRNSALSAVCHYRSVFNEETREGIWMRTFCWRVLATQRPNPRSLLSHGVIALNH